MYWTFCVTESGLIPETQYRQWVESLEDRFEDDFVTTFQIEKTDRVLVPDPHGASIVSVAEAIEHQRRSGLFKNYEYQSDAIALEDFLINNWAYPVELV